MELQSQIAKQTYHTSHLSKTKCNKTERISLVRKHNNSQHEREYVTPVIHHHDPKEHTPRSSGNITHPSPTTSPNNSTHQTDSVNATSSPSVSAHSATHNVKSDILVCSDNTGICNVECNMDNTSNVNVNQQSLTTNVRTTER